MASSADFFDLFLLATVALFFRKRLGAVSAASTSKETLFDAFGAADGVFDDDARFFMARPGLGSPGARAVLTTTGFPPRIFSPDVSPSP
jgi:hypothetical protein